jgi:hypothetical protein
MGKMTRTLTSASTVLASLIVAIGCCETDTHDGADAGNPGRDSGSPMEDGGVTPMEDGGPMEDDGGPPPDDAGPLEDGGPRPVCMVDTPSDGSYPEFPSACLPRCAAETASAIAACSGDRTCSDNALFDDMTPPAILVYAPGEMGDVTCYSCYEWFRGACTFDLCATERMACGLCMDDYCDEATTGCETEEAALNGCIATRASEIDSCTASRATVCFDMP